MKTASVKWYNETIHTNLILESYEDILEYQEMLSKNTSDTFYQMVTRKIPVDRWDHYGSSGEYGNSFNLAVQKCKMLGGRPILEFDKVTNSKCANMLKIIQMGKSIVVNQKGGYCDLNPSIHEVISELVHYEPKSQRKAVINKNTKYINLENDPELENRTKEYLGELDINYSYILGLREYDFYELVDIFTEFKENGGEVVYVYTTGTDTVQMWEYCKSIVKSGLKIVEFEFNAGEITEHKEIIQYLIDNQIEVKIIEDF